jgi:hypothetical protein
VNKEKHLSYYRPMAAILHSFRQKTEDETALTSREPGIDQSVGSRTARSYSRTSSFCWGERVLTQHSSLEARGTLMFASAVLIACSFVDDRFRRTIISRSSFGSFSSLAKKCVMFFFCDLARRKPKTPLSAFGNRLSHSYLFYYPQCLQSRS